MTLVLPMTGFHRGLPAGAPGDIVAGSAAGANRLLPDWGEKISAPITNKSNVTPREFLCTSRRAERLLTPDPSVNDATAAYEGGRHQSSCVLGQKRKLDCVDQDDLVGESRPKRISALWNTPKQRRDDKRKVLRISVQKLRQIDDPEHFLRRSVLINNTMKRMQREIRDEKCHGYGHFYRPHFPAMTSPYSAFEPRDTLPGAKFSNYRDVIGGTYLSANAHLFDDVYTQTGDCGRITDDMTDRLVRSLEQTTADESRDRSTNNVTVSHSTTNSVTDEFSNNNNLNNNNNINNNNLTAITKSNNSCLGKLNNNTKGTSCMTSERQLLGDIDAVFNNLICALSSDP